jgi:hypothetical protein
MESNKSKKKLIQTKKKKQQKKKKNKKKKKKKNKKKKKKKNPNPFAPSFKRHSFSPWWILSLSKSGHKVPAFSRGSRNSDQPCRQHFCPFLEDKRSNSTDHSCFHVSSFPPFKVNNFLVVKNFFFFLVVDSLHANLEE